MEKEQTRYVVPMNRGKWEFPTQAQATRFMVEQGAGSGFGALALVIGGFVLLMLGVR